jgi:hypothetical protein
MKEQLELEKVRDVKMTLKSSNDDQNGKLIILNKHWLRRHIPHIREVISDVKDSEGVEITINCNVEAFQWIIKRLKRDDIEVLKE